MNDITDIEKQSNIIAKEVTTLDGISTAEELFADSNGENSNKYVGVQYDDRVQFLRENDYAVTRENLINPHLSAR